MPADKTRVSLRPTGSSGSRGPLRSLGAGAGLMSRAHGVPDVGVLPRADRAPSWRRLLAEGTSPLEALRLPGAARRLSGIPRGDGHVVIDIPGWQAPEVSGLPLRRYLAWLGYDARGWTFGKNLGDPARDAIRLTESVEAIVQQSGRPVSLVGWSLGGVIAREVARQRPELVRRVVTYGTPVVGGPTYTAVAGTYAHEVREHASRVTERLDAQRPITRPITVVFSRRDGIVAWPACVDHVSPDAEHVEVRSTHVGMGIDPDVWAVVAERLHRPA